MDLSPSAHPLRIVLATDFALPRLGGIETHLDELASVLAARGHSPTLLTATPGADRVQHGYEIQRLNVPLLPGGIAFPGRLVRRLEESLRAGSYDVLHVHLSLISPLGFAAIAAARRLGLPCVVTLHSMVGRATPVLRLLDWVNDLARWPFVMSAVSDTVAGQVMRAVPGLDVRRLPNAVHAQFWQGAGTQTPDDAVCFVCAMRLTSRKRPLALLAAARSAQRQLGTRRRLHLIYAGEGPSQRLLALNSARAHELKVELLPRLSHGELSAVYRRAHAFVLPTVLEAFGRAALEARCAGLPVIAMRHGGVSEYIRHGETGLLAHDDKELAEHLVSLALNEPLRHHLAAADTGLGAYDWPNAILDHEAAYRDARSMLHSVPFQRDTRDPEGTSPLSVPPVGVA